MSDLAAFSFAPPAHHFDNRGVFEPGCAIAGPNACSTPTVGSGSIGWQGTGGYRRTARGSRRRRAGPGKGIASSLSRTRARRPALKRADVLPMSGPNGMSRLLFAATAAFVSAIVVAACAIQLRGDDDSAVVTNLRSGTLYPDVPWFGITAQVACIALTALSDTLRPSLLIGLPAQLIPIVWYKLGVSNERAR